MFVNLDFETIQSRGYNNITQAMLNYIISNHKQYKNCTGNVELNATYHPHLLIEYVGDNVRVPLTTFPPKITFNNEIYFLVGIVHYSSRSNKM